MEENYNNEKIDNMRKEIQSIIDNLEEEIQTLKNDKIKKELLLDELNKIIEE